MRNGTLKESGGILSYFDKFSKITVLDLLIIAVIGGLAVNIVGFVTKILAKKIRGFVLCKIITPIKNKAEDRGYRKRVRSKKLNTKDELKVSRKKSKGEATREELEALKITELERYKAMPPEQKEKIAKTIKSINEAYKRL